MRTRVKICGITRVDDAANAARLGADAIGLVFYPLSPRCIDLEQGRAIVNALPSFTTVVGLFVDQAPQQVYEVLEYVNIDLLQFHGDESPAYCAQFGRPYIKAVRMSWGVDVQRIARQYHDAKGLLLDADSRHAKGGTGCTFDWEWVPKNCALPLILAGGLTPENVGEAITRVRPYAVDVSSGVELSKGIKDVNKLARFLREVQNIDHATYD